MHIDGRNKNILILSERPTQGLDHATITAEVKYPINFTESTKRFVLSLHYNRSNSFLIVNAAKIYQFKAKGSQEKPYPLSLGNVSKDVKLWAVAPWCSGYHYCTTSFNKV